MARQKKRADGRLQKAFTINGKRYFIYGRTPEELFRKEQEKRRDLKKGIERRINPTISEYAQEWQERRRDSVKASSIRSQGVWIGTICGVMMPDINRPFGELHLQEIRPADCFALQNSIRESHTTRTTNDYMALVRQILEDARKQRIIDFNPTDTLRTLKRTEPAARDTIHRALEDEEAEKVLEAMGTNYHRGVVEFALATGCRVGEIGALRMSDIRSDHIEIRRTVIRTGAGYEIGQDAKTAAGMRDIPLNEELRRIIAEQRERLRMLNGNIVSLDSRLFPAMYGGILSPTSVDRAIANACKAAGVERFTAHALRSTFISRALSAGANPKILADIVGQDDLAMTLKLYGHTYSTDRAALMLTMDEWKERRKEA